MPWAGAANLGGIAYRTDSCSLRPARTARVRELGDALDVPSKAMKRFRDP